MNRTRQGLLTDTGARQLLAWDRVRVLCVRMTVCLCLRQDLTSRTHDIHCMYGEYSPTAHSKAPSENVAYPAL